jgi:hypothetical protein
MSLENIWDTVRYTMPSHLEPYGKKINKLTQEIHETQKQMGQTKLVFPKDIKMNYGQIEETTEEAIERLEAKLNQKKAQLEEENKPEAIAEMSIDLNKMHSGYEFSISRNNQDADIHACSTKAQMIKHVTKLIEEIA